MPAQENQKIWRKEGRILQKYFFKMAKRRKQEEAEKNKTHKKDETPPTHHRKLTSREEQEHMQTERQHGRAQAAGKELEKNHIRGG